MLMSLPDRSKIISGHNRSVRVLRTFGRTFIRFFSPFTQHTYNKIIIGDTITGFSFYEKCIATSLIFVLLSIGWVRQLESTCFESENFRRSWQLLLVDTIHLLNVRIESCLSKMPRLVVHSRYIYLATCMTLIWPTDIKSQEN